jgi:energy-coupling factor transport system ATP-binding protein
MMVNELSTREPIIDAREVTYAYPGFGEPALDSVSLSIFERDFIAIIGQNGSGKTTLAKHFNGLLRPAKGEVIVDGLSTRDKKITVGQLSSRVGYVFQNPDRQLIADTVEKEISFGLVNIGLPEDQRKARIDEVISALKLERHRLAYPRVLPVGLKKKIAIASVFAMHPKVIIFDEPTMGQDYNGVLDIMGLARAWNERGGTVIFITHDMQLVAKYAERVAIMVSSKLIAEGEPARIFRNNEVLRLAALRPPQVVELAESLEEYSPPESILTVDDFADWFEARGKMERTAAS